MNEGCREKITVAIDFRQEIGRASFVLKESEISGIRVGPACKYSDGGARTLTPEELNTAVQMWMNKVHNVKMQETSSLPTQIITFPYEFIELVQTYEREIARLNAHIKDLEDQQRTIPFNPDEWICIDLGEPYKKIYIRSPEKQLDLTKLSKLELWEAYGFRKMTPEEQKEKK